MEDNITYSIRTALRRCSVSLRFLPPILLRLLADVIQFIVNNEIIRAEGLKARAAGQYSKKYTLFTSLHFFYLVNFINYT